MRALTTLYAGVCVVAALAAPVLFFLLGGQALSARIPNDASLFGFCSMAVLVGVALPAGLIAAVRRAHQGIERPVFRGLVTGLGMALWCNAAAASWEWMGVYPSTPVLLVMITTDVRLDRPLHWAMLMLGNLVLWTVVCAAATAALQRTVPKPDAPAQP